MNHQTIVLVLTLGLTGCVPEIRVVASDAGSDASVASELAIDSPDAGLEDAGIEIATDVSQEFDRPEVPVSSDKPPAIEVGATDDSGASLDSTPLDRPAPPDAGAATDVTADSVFADMLADRGCLSCPVQRSCPDVGERGCGLVEVNGGLFSLGSAETSTGEPLSGTVSVSSIVVDSHEVTVSRFRRFWMDGHPTPSGPIRYPNGANVAVGATLEPISPASGQVCNWSAAAGGRESHPINCADWNTAQAFCAWDGGRLPTEAEYEYLVRYRPITGSTVPRRYPWGNEDLTEAIGGFPRPTPCDRAQFQECVGENGARTRQVGSFPGNGGLFDLAGNVTEWMADSPDTYGFAPCWGPTPVHLVNPLCQQSGGGRSVRGGHFHSGGAANLLGAERDSRVATASDDVVGFRCVRSP